MEAVLFLFVIKETIWETLEADPEGTTGEAATEAASEGTQDPGRCTRQLAASAERNARFLLSPQRAGRFTARNAS